MYPQARTSDQASQTYKQKSLPETSFMLLYSSKCKAKTNPLRHRKKSYKGSFLNKIFWNCL